MGGDESADRELFDHLAAEFGDRGRDSVGFLETAQRLVAEDAAKDLPRRAGAAAYCIREALERLLPAESGQPSWRRLSSDVLDAKTRFEAVRGLPGADDAAALGDVLAAIGRLEEFKKDERSQRERRLAGLMEARTGVLPFSIALADYQRLARELNDTAVHGSASVEQVQELLGRALSVLRTVFAPFQMRQPELDQLAKLSDPREEDVGRLLSMCSTPHHLSYFMQHVITPRWLSLLTPHGVLDPPIGGGVWPASFAVERLAPTHAQEVAAWLAEAYKRWGATEIGAARIAGATRGCLPAAAPTLLRALRDYPQTHWIRAQAAAALGDMDPTNPFIQAVAEVLLDPSDEVALTGTARQTIRALVDGMTPANADERIVLLAGKLAAGNDIEYLLLSVTDSGYLEDIAERGKRGIGVLVKGVVAAVGRARELGLPTKRTLALLEPIPRRLLVRLRAWVLTNAADVPPEALVSEITHAIADRDPTGDDVRLMQRITTEFSSDLYLESWREALGSPPTPVQVGQALASHDVPREWLRALLWRPLVPDSVGRAWDTTGTLISPIVRAPERESYLEPPSELESASARSPISKTDLERLDVAEAARVISSWRPTGDHLIIARELARTLQEVVASNPRAWASRPLETLALLRHPIYVNHYFGGLAQSSGDLAGLGPQLVEAVIFARTHPWEPVRLGDDDFDYDPTWQPADNAGVMLIGRLAEHDVDLGDRYGDAWEVVLAAARDRSRLTGIGSRDDPLETAINRPCTRAFQAVFQLMATEFRRNETVREQALELLDEVLELDGWDGAEYRAIIAPRLPFLLHVAPEWVETREATLLGDQAPDALGQKTVELALKWGRPHRWLLERHRRAVRRAVRAGATNALDHLLVAMLWDSPGYSIDETFRGLASMSPSVVSDAGEHLARLLMHDARPEHINRAVLFWEQALEDQSLAPEAFRGFGWWSQVEDLYQDRWERMTLETCERAQGSLNFPIEVAERCLREPTTAGALHILTRLLRGQREPWERARVAEIALRALRASSSDATLAGKRDRLRGALMDLGYFDATDL